LSKDVRERAKEWVDGKGANVRRGRSCWPKCLRW
jgi:hypothetical protein